MSRGRLAIIGAGGNAREIADVCHNSGYSIAGFLTNSAAGSADSPNLGDFSWLESNPIDGLVMGVGSPQAKLKLSAELKQRFPAIPWPVIVDPSAVVGSGAKLEEGVILCVRAVLTVNISIGAFTQVNFSTSIGHEARIGSGCILNPGACINGGVVLGDAVLVGSNATILQYLTIGAGARVGAGAVVTRNVAAGATVVGIPAQPGPPRW